MSKTKTREPWLPRFAFGQSAFHMFAGQASGLMR
ncbi:Hypothetical protein BAAA_4000069 [Brucella abortus str. 2308 A]|nr:Hypothetical protein BAAA_4000069 [Brucella abortus str. 2308 A]